jgi:hypothetical protein
MGKRAKTFSQTPPRYRTPSNDPTTAREALGLAFKAAGPKVGAAYDIAREKVEGPARAALGKMSRRGRIVTGILGILLTALVGSATVNHVARPTIAAAARASLGPSYRIQCQLTSGNWGVCPGQGATRR